MDNVGLYSEARNEYLKQLSTWIIPPLVDFFRTEYDRISHEVGGRRAMGAFQTLCAEVPRWNQDVIDKNINAVLDNCRCDYVEELMTAIFIAHTKMLTAIRVSTKHKKLSITLPKLDHFLHRVFVECARSFWKAPFLFSEELTLVEKQKNVLQAESMCVEALSGAVRSLLPVKNILRDYLDEDDAEEAPLPQAKDKKKKKQVDSDSDSDSSSEDEEIQVPVMPPIVPIDLSEAPKQEPELPKAEAPKEEPKEEKPNYVLEKLTTPPTATVTAESNHEIKDAETKGSEVQVTKLEEAAAPNLMIDTEPAVHFTPYDTVFDENKPGVSEIRYTEKLSVEDKPPSNWGLMEDDDEDEVPKIQISGIGESIGLGDDVEDLEKGTTVPEATVDIDEPLGGTLDFEELV